MRKRMVTAAAVCVVLMTAACSSRWTGGTVPMVRVEGGAFQMGSDDGTKPVGTKAANSLGLYDMSGNVWEWCWDRYGGYSGGTQTDPRGAPSGLGRVGRGGSWSDSAQNIRSTSRNYGAPFNRGNSLGFRLVRS